MNTLSKKNKFFIFGGVVILLIVVLSAFQFFSGKFLTGNLGAIFSLKRPTLQSEEILSSEAKQENQPLRGTLYSYLDEPTDGTPPEDKFFLNTLDGKFVSLPYKKGNIDLHMLGKTIQVKNIADSKSMTLMNAGQYSTSPYWPISQLYKHHVLVMTMYDSSNPPPNHKDDVQIQQEMTFVRQVYEKNAPNLSFQFDYYPTELGISGNLEATFPNSSSVVSLFDTNGMITNAYTDYFIVYYGKNNDDSCHGISIFRNNFQTSEGNFNFAVGEAKIGCIVGPHTLQYLAVHEMGHLLGLRHAGLFYNDVRYDETDPSNPVVLTSDCLNKDITDPLQFSKIDGAVLLAQCHDDYGDDTFMGIPNEGAGNYWFKHQYLLSPTQRKKLGDSINTLQVTVSGTYSLSSDGIKAHGYDEITVPEDDLGSYSIEYRNVLIPEIVIRFATSQKFLDKFSNAYGWLSDNFPETFRMKDSYISSLVANGESFTDNYKKMIITVVDLPLTKNSSPTAKIKITFSQ